MAIVTLNEWEIAMKTTERIFNALLFEAIALAIIIPFSALISGKGTSELVIVGIALSLYTVVWNYFYNLGFDRVFGANREQRTLKTRILHTFGFEGGLIFISIPTIAWFLQIGWLAAMGLEAVFLIFFFFYSTLFHWCYDKYQPYKTWFSMQATKVK